MAWLKAACECSGLSYGLPGGAHIRERMVVANVAR